MSGPEYPPELSFTELGELLKWLEIKGVPADEPMRELVIAGTMRNVLRISQKWGPILIATMAKEGLLEPEDSPLEALKKILPKKSRRR